MRSEPEKLHLIRGGNRTTTDVEFEDPFQNVRRLLLEVAEELGPRQALAALEIERVEITALIARKRQAKRMDEVLAAQAAGVRSATR